VNAPAAAGGRVPAVPFSATGSLPFRRHHTWYGVVGEAEEPGRLPLLVVHGGPGSSHDYLEPLAGLARGRRLVFYDQLGCGRSDHPHDASLWSVELFEAELAALRHALGLARCHLLGQSWGGALALAHAAADPGGIAGLALADPLVCTADWIAEADRLRAELPKDVQAVLRRHELAGTTDDAAYQQAMMVYYWRHVCRVDPWPECLQRSFAALQADPEVYLTMWGPSEFHCTGLLAHWDVRPRLAAVEAPALVLGGRYDECTPAIQEDLHRRLPGSEWVVFEQSSHMPHLEEPERFLTIVDAFLRRVEGAA
jgi:L-proline amide hydrolase